MAAAAFPRNVRYTPVPNPLFGPVLEQIDDLSELKCTLRVIWLLHQKKGHPRYVSLSELMADRVLAKALAGGGEEVASAVQSSLDRAVARGTLTSSTPAKNGSDERLYALNREGEDLGSAARDGRLSEDTAAGQPVERVEERPNIFSLYEDNVGLLSPMIAEQLKEAEELYPESWIEDAFREAVENNKRSWRYIAAILENWDRQGREDGGPRRHPKKAGYQEYFRR